MLHGVIPLLALLPATSCATPDTQTAPISAKTGLFENPNNSGQGLITVANNGTFFAGWLARDPAAAADDPHSQAWFSLQGSLDSNDSLVHAKIYRTLGGRRDSRLPIIHQEVGRATLTFPSCERLTMQYQFFDAEFVEPFRNLSGALNLTRVGACH